MRRTMQSRKQDALDQLAGIYLLASAGLAIALFFLSFAQGVGFIGAPKWAWILWVVGIFVAISISKFLGHREHIPALLGTGIVPLFAIVLVGIMGSPEMPVTTGNTPIQALVTMQDVYTLTWVISLVLTPVLALLLSCAGWYDKSRGNEPGAA